MMAKLRTTWLGLVVVFVFVGGTLVAGCGNGSSADTSGATTTSGAQGGGSAKISSFDVPKTTPCTNQTYTTVQVSYATSDAARVELRVDGRPIPLSDPAGGTVAADVKCDALPHDFVLFAYDADDRYTSAQARLQVT